MAGPKKPVNIFRLRMVCDKIGRFWATRQLYVLWIVGITIFIGVHNLPAIYASRFIAGLGVGQTIIVGPVYLAEVAPASIRGLCTCVFTGFVYLGIVVAYFANYGSELHIGDHSHNRWLVPTSLHIMFAGIILLLSFCQNESPRFLIKQNKPEDALKTLARNRNLPPDHEDVVREITAIQHSHQDEVEATMGSGPLGVLKEALLIRSKLYRLYLAAMARFMAPVKSTLLSSDQHGIQRHPTLPLRWSEKMS